MILKQLDFRLKEYIGEIKKVYGVTGIICRSKHKTLNIAFYIFF